MGIARQLLAVTAVLLLVSSLVAAAVAPAAGAQAVDDSDVVGVSIPEEDRTIISRQAQHFTEADFDQSNVKLLSDSPVTQELNAVLDIEGNSGTETLVIDYSEAADAGLGVPVSVTDSLVGDGPLAGAVEDVEVQGDAGEFEITYDTAQTGDVSGETQTFDLQFVDNNFVGSDFEGNLVHTVTIGSSSDSTASARFRATDRGATAVAPEDAAYDLARDDGPLAENVDPRRNGGTGAFDIWQGQRVTFQTEDAGNAVEIYEYETEGGYGDPDIVRRGDQVARIGTAPGATTNFDTAELEAGQRYIVEFVDYSGYADDESPVVIFDVDPLNLEAEASPERFHKNTPAEIDVGADDISGGNLTVFLLDDSSDTVLGTTDDRLDGDGEAVVDVDATETLDGTGDYRAIVQHDESEVTTGPVTFSVVGGYAEVDGEEPVQLAAREEATIVGTTSYDPGTELEVEILAIDDRDPTIVKRATGTVKEAPGETNEWRVTVDLSEIETERQVRIEIERTDAVGLVTPDGSVINGTIVTELCLDVDGNGECATDTTGDGLLNDIDGDGEFTIVDVQALFENRDSDVIENNAASFDFDSDDEVTIVDVRALFNQLVG